MVKINREAIDEFVKTAYESGVPKDQVENFLVRGYVPLRWQWKFHAEARNCDKTDEATELGVGGARGPGKSHCVFAQVTLDDCQRKDGLKFLFLRQTGKAARESFEDLILKVLSGRTEYKYNTSSGFLSFFNGSRVLLGGFETERDIDKYIGIEYDGIAIEELNQLTKNKVDKLLGSMRTSRKDWRPRLYTSFNPGGIGHDFVKKKFVIPFQEGKETKTRFIPSTYKDNPYLNKEYIDYLEGLSGNLGKAWREGDFDLFEGQFFTEFSRLRHVVEPFTIPESWLRFRSIDPSGRDGITSCHWYALDWNSRVFVYREHYGTGKDADQHALEIARLSEGEKYRYTVIDSAAFSKLGLPETMAEIYERCGVSGLTPASKQRVVGWNTVHTYLRWDKNSDPKLKIFSTCKDLIRTLPTLVHDELHPEDLNSKGEDHCFIGNTKIDTFWGKRKIKDLAGKEVYVNTLEGFKKCQSVRKTRKVDVYKITLENGKQIISTADHRFLTNNGWKELGELDNNDYLIKSNICIKSYLKLFRNLMENAITLAEDFSREKVNGFISRCESIIKTIFRKGFISTTRTGIGTIITYPTLKRLKHISIYPFTLQPQKQKQGQENLLRKREYLRLNGINQKREGNGTESMLLKCGRRENILKRFVRFVGKSIKQEKLEYQNTVIKIVKLQPAGEDWVFNLTVSQIEHFTIEGGIVVHNCADELRYYLQTLRAGHTQRPLNFVEQRLKEMREQEGDFNLRYTKSDNLI